MSSSQRKWGFTEWNTVYWFKKSFFFQKPIQVKIWNIGNAQIANRHIHCCYWLRGIIINIVSTQRDLLDAWNGNVSSLRRNLTYNEEGASASSVSYIFHTLLKWTAFLNGSIDNIRWRKNVWFILQWCCLLTPYWLVVTILKLFWCILHADLEKRKCPSKWDSPGPMGQNQVIFWC